MHILTSTIFLCAFSHLANPYLTFDIKKLIKLFTQDGVEEKSPPELHCAGSRLSPILRSMIHRFHNNLRRKVAKGQYYLNGSLYGPASNLYELVYDCHMEQIAGRLHNFTEAKEFGINFSEREVPEDGMLRGVIEEILQSWANTDALLQIIHVYTTRIGCHYNLIPTNWTFNVVCLYDNKLKNGELLFEKGAACSHNDNCTLLSPSMCFDGLCSVVAQEQFDNQSQ